MVSGGSPLGDRSGGWGQDEGPSTRLQPEGRGELKGLARRAEEFLAASGRAEVLSPKALGSSDSVSDLIKDNPEAVRRVEALADELVEQAACLCRRG